MEDELTDRQWAMIQPLIPKQTGPGKPRADDRETLDAVLYVLSTGCRWENQEDRLQPSLHDGLEEAEEVGGGRDVEEDGGRTRLEGILSWNRQDGRALDRQHHGTSQKGGEMVGFD